MPGRKQRKNRLGPPGPGSTAADRVSWLLSAVWGDNRSAMAEAVGVTHSVLTKIAAGQQNPGRRLIDAIGAHPKVNPVWLATGEGEPLLADRKSGTGEGWPIPISRQLLAGPLEEHSDMLTGESFPVAGMHYRPSRYWLYVLGDNPVSRSVQTSIEVGDLLLIETDSNSWKDPEAVDRHLCVLRTNDAPRMGMLNWCPGEEGDPPRLTAEFFSKAKVGERSKLIERITVDKYPNGRLVVRSNQRGKSPSTVIKPGHPEQVNLGDIVGVCKLMLREF